MKVKDMKPTMLLLPDDGNCFQIPPFQRAYVWPLDRVHRLVRDIAKALNTVNESGHWLGVILLAQADRKCERANVFGHECWDILDGQQRSISLRLWLIALNDEYERQHKSPLPGLSRERLTNIRVHSLNQKQWNVISDQTKLKSEKESHQNSDDSNAILRTYWYFRWLLLNGLDGLDAERDEHLASPRKKKSPRSAAIQDMAVVEYWLHADTKLQPLGAEYLINLARSTADRLTLAAMQHEHLKDEPVEEIFETLNAERTELGQFDLARNFFFISLPSEGSDQKKVYDDYFFKAEASLRNAGLDLRRDALDIFLYDYLSSTGKFDSGLGLSNTAANLKARWSDINRESTVMKFLTEKLTPAMYAWLAIRSGSTRISANNDLEHELGESVARQLMRIESFSKGPFVPITLRILLEWMERGSASAIDLGANLHLIETYAARALLSAEPFSPMRRNIRNLCTALENGTTSLENWVREHSASDERIRLVMEQSCSIEGTENPPDKWISERDLGERSEPRQLTALFDGLSVTLEGPLSKMIVRKPNKRMKRNTKNPFWIEHYYPQKARRWEVDLEHWGVNPEHMENRLNAIGNLSVLTNFGNAKMSNKPLAEKQTDYREAKVPAFKLNLDFMTADRWTTKEIDERTRMLVRAALEFWRLPAAP